MYNWIHKCIFRLANIKKILNTQNLKIHLNAYWPAIKSKDILCFKDDKSTRSVSIV